MATILDLLMALNQGNLPPLPDPAKPMPIPLAPTTGLGPLSNDTSLAFGAQNPEPVPPAFVQPAPIDTTSIDQRVGPAPVAPTVQQPGFLDKLAAVLGGVGAGFQGRGGEFAAGIRAEREAPFRRYEAQVADYTQRRDRAFEIAERRADREAEQANRLNEQVYERDFKTWLSKNNDRDDASKEAVRQAFIRERDVRAERLAAERQVQAERRQQERDARQIEERYFTASKNRTLSRELGRHWAGLSDAPLSPAAARLDAKLQGVGEVRMGKAAGIGRGGGGTGGGPSSAVENTLAEFETLKQMAIQAIKAQGGTPQDEIEAVRRATAGVVRKMARQPRLFEVGTGRFGYLYAQPRGGAPAPAPELQGPIIPPEMKRAAQGPSDADVKAYAKRFKMSPDKARKELSGQ